MTPGPKKLPHVPFLGDDTGDPREHGERAPEAHEDDLLGTSGTHGGPTDSRAEEPHGEIAASSTAEGGDD